MHAGKYPLKHRGERGAALVEFVIVSALFIFLVFGIMEMGFMLSNQTTVTMAAQRGARAAALYQNPTVVENVIRGAASSLRDQATLLDIDVYSVTPDGVQTKMNPGVNWPVDKPLPATTDQVIVEVHYEYHWITGSLLSSIGNLLSGTSDGPPKYPDLRGRAVMRYGG